MSLGHTIAAANEFALAVLRDSQDTYQLAREILWDVPCSAEKVQGMLDYTRFFKEIYPPKAFENYGHFLSEMIRKAAIPGEPIVLDTRNTAVVHLPAHYIWDGKELASPKSDLREYETEHLLLNNLASGLGRGIRVIVKGNVGSYFASGNYGASISLEGECGPYACTHMRDREGEFNLKGIAGHRFAMYTKKGTIRVEGSIRSIGEYFNKESEYDIVLNGQTIEKPDSFISPADQIIEGNRLIRRPDIS
ncbi:MAG: hypothetical protein Q7K45_02315 [Nanoarchaeota archaeon]|nr:hypothetical protein [Nanoarchaeota archaeon]